MMHYRKGENVEKKLTKEELPFEDFLPKDTEFLWMHVNGGTKVSNVLGYAKNALDKGEHKHVVWSGNGGGVVKTVSCAEILKRSYPLYQVTRTCYITVEEHWKPQLEGLEEIVVNRRIPSLHIFMSLEPINEDVSGLQKPNTKTDFWVHDSDQNAASISSSSRNNHKNKKQGSKPKSNQNKYLRQTPTNSSNNEETSNSASTSSCANKQTQKYNKKSRRPKNDRAIQNSKSNADNSNPVESMES